MFNKLKLNQVEIDLLKAKIDFLKSVDCNTETSASYRDEFIEECQSRIDAILEAEKEWINS